MKVNPNIFKAYDVRGVYPEEINEKTAYLVGRAFVKFLRKKRLKIAVGRDNRLSSDFLSKSLSKGILEAGADLIDLGLTTSPMFYWASYRHNLDGGIIVTASHNPSEYNGFKFVKEKAIPISAESGLKDIQKLTSEVDGEICKKGIRKKKEITKEYIDFNFKPFDLSKIRKMKIIVDTANSVGGIMIPFLSKKLNCQIVHIFKELDGSFPNHQPNPLAEENLESLKKEFLLKKADMGVAFDGDADRMILVDEKGETLRGDLLTALISELLLRENPGGKIIYDVRASNIVPETIKKNGGFPICYKIGHSFIKEKMRREKAVFAGELSGHYYSKEHYFLESPIFVLLKVLQALSSEKIKLSLLIDPYKKYFYSNEINFVVKDKQKIMVDLEKKFKKEKISKIDGLRVDFKNWWFLVRPSNTEPVFRLVLEAGNKKIMEEKKKELSSFILSR